MSVGGLKFATFDEKRTITCGLAWFCQWKIRLVELSLCGTTCFINLVNIDLINICRITQCLSVPKVTQIGSGVLKMRAVKHSGPVFIDPSCRHIIFIYYMQLKGKYSALHVVLLNWQPFYFW